MLACMIWLMIWYHLYSYDCMQFLHHSIITHMTGENRHAGWMLCLVMRCVHVYDMIWILLLYVFFQHFYQLRLFMCFCFVLVISFMYFLQSVISFMYLPLPYHYYSYYLGPTPHIFLLEALSGSRVSVLSSHTYLEKIWSDSGNNRVVNQYCSVRDTNLENAKALLQ